MANKAGRMVKCPTCGQLYDNTRYRDHQRTKRHKDAWRSMMRGRGPHI